MKKINSYISNDICKLIVGAILFVSAIITSRFEFTALALSLYIAALFVSGFGVYIDAVKGILRGDFLDEKFLMAIASIGAMIIGEYSEGVAVMLFFLLGEIFEHKAVSRSRNKIRALMDICPDEATVIRDGEETVVDADDVEVGETLIIRAGQRVAADCVVISGFADADTSALTGESIPRPLSVGSAIESGTIIINGLLRCEVLKKSSESGAQRILNMVENASEHKSKEENFITVFSKVYTPIVVALAVFIAIVPSLFHITEWNDSIHRALIFLVISCPCALVISVPMAFFGGIGAAASRGILFKGGNAFAPVARTKTVAFDKTGTLTRGEFDVKCVMYNTIPEDELLRIAASVEYGSDHPIANCLKKAGTDLYEAESVRELAGKGAIGIVGGASVAVGNEALMNDEAVHIPAELKAVDESLVFCARDGVFLGAIVIGDTVKSEAKEAIRMLTKVGISRTLILSGDKKSRAEAIGKSIGIDEVKAELMPEDKFSELKSIITESGRRGKGKTMYVGDGINDAPSLALADVGVAMGAIGSDSAIESADLVIMSDNLLRLPEAIEISRKTLAIAKQNIGLALGIKVAVMILGAIGYANMWLAVFADVGVAVLAILNAMRALIVGKRDKK